MDILIYLIIGLVLGAAAAWIITTLAMKVHKVPRRELDESKTSLNEVRTALSLERDRAGRLSENLRLSEEKLQNKLDETKELHQAVASYKARLESAMETIEANARDMADLKSQHKESVEQLNQTYQELSRSLEANKALQEKLETQKQEIEDLGKKINMEFEHIASKILDEKSEKFTRQNKDNLEIILKPLGENIDRFRKKVEEVYDRESKERFSLGKEVQRLMELNQKVSEDAVNLTNALKGSSKTQGDWGQMILENILEQSGLVRDREYFVQEYLKDEDGNYLKNESGKRMQPDVIIHYPDNRNVIIDSKVSLSAYTRYVAATGHAEQEKALKEHIISLRRHVDDLSSKTYQDYALSLDFVMMFVPVEPAYMLALKNDQDLWNYSYRKRILLISPTNLIAALKLIEDLWKREYQNQNALAIAERGAALYDKFVGFVENLSNVGGHLDKARKSYDDAYGQLKAGRGNLIGQAEKLRELGVKAKKNLPSSLLEEAGEDQ